MINYDGIDEASLVLALYMGAASFAFTPGNPAGMIDAIKQSMGGVTLEGVRAELPDYTYDDNIDIDYFHGRPLKVFIDLKTKQFDPRLYDRGAGSGRAQRIVDELRARSK